MWCTRWFLPLVILPLPTAPPYFLAVFLVSLFLHARPCFYCMMLLTALFTSSCYWQAVPVESALTYPIGNATTFGEALRTNLSIPLLTANSSSTGSAINKSTDASENWNVNVDLPPVVQLIDRCWCNVFSRSGLFHPGDVAAWEKKSVDQARKAVESQYAKHKEKENVQGHGVEAATGDASGSNLQATPSDESTQTEHIQKDPNSRFALRGLRDLLFPTMTTSATPKYRLIPGHPLPSAPHPLAATDGPKATSKAHSTPQPGETKQPESVLEAGPAKPEPSITDAPPLPTQPTKLLRPYYDLRPYGLDITIDFRWNR